MWFSSPGTSGDTGGSAIQSAKGLCGLDVVVVYPRGRVTPVQEKHMITCLEDNVHVFAGKHEEAEGLMLFVNISLLLLLFKKAKSHTCILVLIIFHNQFKYVFKCVFASVADGSSDDIDQPLRRLFTDQELVRSHGLMSLNSVNRSRVMIQLAHFIYAYLELSNIEQAEADGDLPELEVVVPTGGAGNIAGRLITAGRELELISKYSPSGLKGG